MIEQASLIIGDGNWAVKSDSLLGYKLIDGKYYPRQMSSTRATTATRVNEDGLVELVPYNLLQYSEQFDNGIWNKDTGSTISTNTTTAPNGEVTADTLTTTNGNYMNCYQITSTLTGTYTYSAYVKNNGTNLIDIYVFAVGIGFASRGQINFSAGTFTTSLGTGTIENAGNGWYRISLTNTYNSALSCGFFTDDNTGTRSVYLWGAQLVEGTIKPYLPTTTRLNIPRADYSTGSPALLAEPQRTNRLIYSEELVIGKAFAYTSGTFSVTQNTTDTLDPFGNNNADKFTAVDQSANDSYTATSGSGNITLSVFAKKGTSNTLVIYHDNVTIPGFFWAQFNIQTGVVLATNGAVFSTSVEDYGNGWFRCSVTGPDTNATGNIHNFTTYAGTSYLFGVQLEQGNYQTSYIPTQAASVTRNADVLSYSSLNSLGITTPTSYSWFLDLGDDTIVNNFDIRLGGIGLYVIGTGGQGTQWSLYNFTAFNQILPNTNITGNRKICLTYNSGVLKVFANNQLLITYSGSITSDTLTFLMSNADNRLVLNTLAIFNTTLSDTDALNLIS